MKAKDYKRFFNICSFRRIVLHDIQIEDNDEEEYVICSCYVYNKDYQELLEIIKKSNVSLEDSYIDGLPKYYHRLKHHIYFVIGAVIALFLLMFFSNRIWDIKLDGNVYYGDETIIRYLKANNIYCGLQKNKIGCIQLADDLRGDFDRITWASIELNGSVLIVHMKENDIIDETINNYKVNTRYDLVAEKSGIIVDTFVRNGITNVVTGDIVKKGNVLINGYIPIKNDASEVVSYENCIADGDVYVFTKYHYYNKIQRIYDKRIIIDEYDKYLLYIDEYRSIDKTNSNEDTMLLTTNYKTSITETFILPVGITKQKVIIYDTNSCSYSDEELKNKAEEDFYQFCKNLEKKGVQIYENNVKIDISDVSCEMSGEVSVIEKIGILKENNTMTDYGSNLEE